MKKTVKLTENDLKNIVKRIIQEQPGYRGNFFHSEVIDKELLQDVIDRMNSRYCENCGPEYKTALRDFNSNWVINTNKIRRM